MRGRYRTSLHHAGLALALLVAGGCKTQRCPKNDAQYEVRDRNGGLEWSLHPDGKDEQVLCDGEDRRVGSMSGQRERLVLRDPSGSPLLEITPGASPEELSLARGGVSFRVYDKGGLLRILDAQGVPLAQLHMSSTAAPGGPPGAGAPESRRALIYDPAGNPLGYAESADGRLVVRARDGAVEHYVIGAHRERAVAAMGLSMFSPLERLALCRYLDEYGGSGQ
ncbi:MAG TPA: hypothetical protein VH877_08890 [Polyangia bacterium]|jgi:hypothetical protein|nr:hypothetical protein [Polyangia bacterium]